MEVSGGLIVGMFRAIAGAIFPSIRKKYFDQPKVFFVFQFNTSSKSPRGISNKNDRTQATFVTEVIYHNELIWKYELLLRNNSEHPAYNIKLISPAQDKFFNLHPPLDSLKPILPNAEVSYKAQFLQFFEGKGEVAVNMTKKFPEKLKQEKFILEYTNVKGTKFYTIYEQSLDTADRHKFSRTLDK